MSMKKRLFLGLIPAILALSACAGITPNNNAEDLDIFQEDTLIHEDIFANSESGLLQKGVKNLDPVQGSEPLIGVQKSDEYVIGETSYLALRFVAVVNIPDLAKASIKWDREIFKADGTSYKSFAEPLEVEKAYTTIFDGEEPLNISNFQGYTHFVTYTVRKIPTANSNYVVAASLIIGGVASDKVVASSIDLTRQVSFPKETTGYFLSGTFNNKPGIVRNQDLLRGVNDKAAFARHIRTGDSFLPVYNDPESNHFEIFSNDVNNNNTLFSKINNKIVANAESEGDIIFFFSNDGPLFSGKVWFYVSGDMNDWPADTNNATGYFFGFNEETDSYELSIEVTEKRTFGIRVRVDNDQNARWWQNQYSWLRAGFYIHSDGNIRISDEGSYILRLYMNDTRNPLGIVKDGFYPRMPDTTVTNVYVRGDAVGAEHGGWNHPLDNTYLFSFSSRDGYRYELLNVHLNVGHFKITTCGTYSIERWQWDGCYINNGHIEGTDKPLGNAADNQVKYTTWESWNIGCVAAGQFDIFIRTDNQLEINYLSA